MKRARNKNFLRTAGAIGVSAVFALSFASCGEYKPKELSGDTLLLTKAYAREETVGGDSSRFTENNLGFATEFFRLAYREGENALVSPLSMAVALAMTANGASGRTLAETEAALGAPVAVINEGLSAYMTELEAVGGEKCKLSIADSVWIRQDAAESVEEEFLRTNGKYFGAEIFSSPFSASTVSDINAWTANKTEGMIDRMLEEIDPGTLLYLINALYFEDEWETKYEEESVYTGEFTDENGKTEAAKMMDSQERIYLSDGDTTGFIKPYRNGAIGLAAFLPVEGKPMKEYVAEFTEKKWRGLFENREAATVNATLPAFEYDFTLTANDALKEMGMTSAFDPLTADFSKTFSSSDVFLGSVVQKTKIEVSEQGTKAAAATIVDGEGTCAPDDEYFVRIDRPFAYAIVDLRNGYPLFIGVVHGV